MQLQKATISYSGQRRINHSMQRFSSCGQLRRSPGIVVYKLGPQKRYAEAIRPSGLCLKEYGWAASYISSRKFRQLLKLFSRLSGLRQHQYFGQSLRLVVTNTL